MKSMMSKAVVAGMVAAVAGTAAAEVSVTADFVSAYVFRGVTQVDEASFQPGVEASGFGLAEEYGSIAIGAWGSADLDGGTSSTFRETDWYGSYSLPEFVEGLDLSVGYTEYMYGAGSSDKEVALGAGYALGGFGLFANYFQGIGGGIGSSTYIDFGVGYDLEATEELTLSAGARAAYASRSDNNAYWGVVSSGESGFADYDLSLALSYALSEKWSAGISAMYIGQIDDKVLSDALYDVDFVGMLGVSCDM